MQKFIRVKSAKRRDPQHKFDVSEETFNRYPERYKRVTEDVVTSPRPIEYAKGVEEPASTLPVSDLPMNTADPVPELDTGK